MGRNTTNSPRFWGKYVDFRAESHFRPLPYRRRGPEYAYLELEGHGFRVLEEPARVTTPDGKARMTVYVDMNDIDGLYARLKPRLDMLPAGDVDPPRDKPWKQREFMVRLPDGDWIAFGQVLGPVSPTTVR